MVGGMRLRHLHTSTEIIDALGGTQAVADLLGAKYTAVFNWRTFGALPANTYVTLLGALEKNGCTASPRLWGMREPEGGTSTILSSASREN